MHLYRLMATLLLSSFVTTSIYAMNNEYKEESNPSHKERIGKKVDFQQKEKVKLQESAALKIWDNLSQDEREKYLQNQVDIANRELGIKSESFFINMPH